MAYVLLILVLLTIILGPQLWVRRVMERYAREDEPNFPGNGGELARHLLDQYGLREVRVEPTDQGDHYDPLERAVRLAPERLGGRSLTAITIAAHEVGHALQHAADEPLFRWRSQLVGLLAPAQRIASFLLFAAPMLVLVTRTPVSAVLSIGAALVLLGGGLLVHLLTLPVEMDASFRKALPILRNGYLTDAQLAPAERILRAAALTYVAGAMAGLVNFWRWLQVLRR